VSEAFNPHDECYGDQRLLAGLATSTGSPAPAVITALLHSVRTFADSTPQSDDIAALVLRVAETPALSAQ
jgi:sigma-B regulation protein RsbU (phosphoserine phosphatase)